MRVAQEQVGAHRAHLLEGEQAQFIQPVVHQGAALGLRRQHRYKADQIAREARPQPGCDAARCLRLGMADAKPVALHRALDGEPLQDGPDDFHVFGPGAAYDDVAAGNRPHHCPTAGLDVVTPEPVLCPVQTASPFDP